MFPILFLIFGVCSHTQIANAAPCKANDKDCMKDFLSDLVKTTLNGIPAIGVETFDPLYIDGFHILLAEINLAFKNVTVIGYKKCEVTSLSTKAGAIKYDMVCPSLIMTSKYEADGQFTFVPVRGKGDAKFTTGKIIISIESEYQKLRNPDGKYCFQFKNKKFTSTALEKIHFEISNLFNGQKDLSDAFLNFADENWKLLSEILLVPILKPSVELLFKGENKYLKNMKNYEDVIIE